MTDARFGGAIGRARSEDAFRVRELARAILPGAGEPRLAETWAARDEAGRVVGWLEERLVASELYVLGVGVDPAWRRRGVATALVRACLVRASVVHLEVRASNAAARRLYAGLGFDEVGLRARYYADGDDAVLLTRAAA
ncbi:MAG: GNAT family N-acetyltransferase [Deltaproteobacteria bacterium]|nr:GNAT family N-acetyltransferase [Deltaproteobacteria bacterium]